jgi:hypothetical protein
MKAIVYQSVSKKENDLEAVVIMGVLTQLGFNVDENN